jgi:hypothetical protein
MKFSPILWSRRNAPFVLRKKTQLSPKNDLGNLDFGSVGEGLSRYELDFAETADWTRGLLEKIESDKKILQGIDSYEMLTILRLACFSVDQF